MQHARLPIAASSILLFAGVFFTNEASAKQCIYNGGGYVLNVHWYHQNDVAVSDRSNISTVDNPKTLRPPVKSDVLTAGFSSCNETAEVMAVWVSVPFCTGIKDPLTGVGIRDYKQAFVSPGITVHVYDPVTGVVRPGLEQLPGCPYVRGYCNALGPVEYGQRAFDPNRPVVLITEPSGSNYLDFWGSFMDVQWGPGKPIPGAGWVNGIDSTLTSDAGRGVIDANPHYQFIAGGGSVSDAAGFVGKRIATLSSSRIPRADFAKLYAAISVTIASVGRARAGWVDGADPKWTADPGRGISSSDAHYQWANGTTDLPKAATFVSSRMTALSSLPRDVYAKLYADVSVLMAKCGVNGQCG